MGKDKKAKNKPEQKIASKGFSTGFILKLVGGLALIPALLFVPSFFREVGRFVKNRTWILAIPWSIYILCQLFVFFIYRRKTHTLDSFTTVNMVHLIFSLGAYHFLSIAEMLPFDIRRSALYIWVTITMFFCVLFLFFDSTDYAEEARIEKEKEKKKEEKKKKRLEAAEKKKKEHLEKNPPFYKKNRVVKIILDLIVYCIYAAIIVFIVRWLYTYVKNFNPNLGEEDEINLSHDDEEVDFRDIDLSDIDLNS